MTDYYKHQYADDSSGVDTGEDLKKDIKKYRNKILHSDHSAVNKSIGINQTEWEK